MMTRDIEAGHSADAPAPVPIGRPPTHTASEWRGDLPDPTTRADPSASSRGVKNMLAAGDPDIHSYAVRKALSL